LTEADGNGFGPVVPDRNGNVPAPGSVTTRLVRWRIGYHAKSDQLSEREVLAVVNGRLSYRRPARTDHIVSIRAYPGSFKLTIDKNGRVFP
jgi:carotenoid cleavage dioxygenase